MTTAAAASSPPEPVTTRSLRDALFAHYRKPGSGRDGEILLTEPEAPDGSGRRADLVRIGVWASRGTGIDVHEIKVSRGDWLRELDDPAKAEAWWPYCSRFWVVAPPGTVASGELPEGWGLMEPRPGARRFRAVVPAALKEPRLTVRLITELMRRADNNRLAEMERLREEHRSEISRVRAEARRQQVIASIPDEIQRRLDLLERLESALGLEVSFHAGSLFSVPGARLRATPEELAALIGDAGDHLAAQRRMAQAEALRNGLARSARILLETLEATS